MRLISVVRDILMCKRLPLHVWKCQSMPSCGGKAIARICNSKRKHLLCIITSSKFCWEGNYSQPGVKGRRKSRGSVLDSITGSLSKITLTSSKKQAINNHTEYFGRWSQRGYEIHWSYSLLHSTRASLVQGSQPWLGLYRDSVMKPKANEVLWLEGAPENQWEKWMNKNRPWKVKGC